MNGIAHSIRSISSSVVLLLAISAHAATVWNGPTISFTKPSNVNPLLAENQDRLTANVWITRGSAQGLFNANMESQFTHYLSPAGTEWANGSLENYATLSYTNWNRWAQGVNPGPRATVGVQAVVHLIAEDIYLSVKFTSWTGGASGGGPSFGGGFAYLRSTPVGPLTTNTWTGADPSGNWSAPANWSPTGVPVNGNDLVFPDGLPPGDMVSTNDLAGSSFRSITFQAGGYTIRGNPMTLTNRSDCIINGGTNVIACDLTFSGTPATPNSQFRSIMGQVAPSGLVSELTLIGTVGGGGLYVLNEQFVISGQFTGGSLYQKYGSLALYGDNPRAVSAEIYGTSISTLRVQGSQPNLNITMLREMETASCPSMSGDGAVGDVTGCGHLALDSTLSLKNVNVGLDIRLNGTNVGAYGKLVASGDVSVPAASLSPSAGFNPQPGQVFTVVEKTSPGPIANAPFGPEGTITNLNGMPFRISYVGGDGNDVTLTAVTAAPVVLGAVHRPLGTQFVFSYSAEVGLSYAVESSATLSNWTTLQTDTASTNPMTVTDTLATNRMNFYRVRRVPNP
jgi:hypothetical protein